MRARTIYFARGLTTGFYKVGITESVDARMRTLRTPAIGEGIELLAAVPGDWQAEQALHRAFARLSEPSRPAEWYRDDGTIAAFVASLPSEQRGSVVYPYERRRRMLATTWTRTDGEARRSHPLLARPSLPPPSTTARAA